MISNLNIYDQYSQYWWSALSILMISSQNQDQLSPLLDQISSQLAEEQFPWQSPVPPQKDAWYALILAFKPFLNFCLCQYLVRVRRKIASVTWQKKTTLFVSVPEETPGYHPTPESSPELTKRSWFVILSTAHVIILVFTSCHCLCHMYSNLISLPCQVWKSHVYREGRELHSGGEGQGACLHQGFRATILPSTPSYSRSPRRLTWSTPSSLWPICSTPCSRRSRSGSSTRGAPPPQPCSSDRWQRNREDWN